MDARPVPSMALTDRPGPDVAALVRLGVPAAIALLGSIALLLAARRLAGALTEPLEAVQLVTTGTMAALATWGLRRLWFARPAPAESDWLDKFVRWASLATVVTMVAALSLPDTSRVALAVVWLVLIAAEIDVYRSIQRRGGRSKDLGNETPPSYSPPVGVVPVSLHEPSETLDEGVLQRLTRRRDEAGGEMVYGLLRAELGAGQQTETLHVAFCPPFARVPQVDVEQADGPEARIKLAEVLACGARIEVRFAQALAEPAHVSVEISARDEQPDGPRNT